MIYHIIILGAIMEDKLKLAKEFSEKLYSERKDPSGSCFVERTSITDISPIGTKLSLAKGESLCTKPYFIT